ncbi:hypothetical protein [Aliiroseovarius crassostreae]|uniref:hypothetical protein n=1 Tax=Aliiroseovarius crassostreae TaxID=154981 RepID=UPI0021FB642D|nr:hypothetical protein [Aliiroseovarius crassostreae]UWP88108.1 hypothetical protein K3J57_09240 [Aliiroseovarius crassostreae]
MTTRFHFFAGHLRGPTGVRPPLLPDRHGLASLGSFLAFGEGICGKKKERGALSFKAAAFSLRGHRRLRLYRAPILSAEG